MMTSGGFSQTGLRVGGVDGAVDGGVVGLRAATGTATTKINETRHGSPK